MRRNFGRFAAGGPVEEPSMFGDTPDTEMPSIAGAGLPNSGIRNKSMGDVFPPKEKFTPQEFAEKNAAMKRMKQSPGQSPLGPLTSGPPKGQPPGGMRPRQQGQQGPPGQAQGQPPQQQGLGGRWMGELWQGLTMDPVDPRMAQPQGGGGYAQGGAVDSGMSVYNQTMRDLQSGGVGGYAQGGMVEKSREIAAEGRGGDSMLMHIQPEELAGLESLLGPTTTNPETGNPEGVLWAPVIAGLVLGGTIGGVSAHAQGGDTGDIALGALTGGTLGAVSGGIAGAGVGAGPMVASGPVVASAPVPGSIAALAAPAAAPVGTGTVLASSGAAAQHPILAGLASTQMAPGAGVLTSGSLVAGAPPLNLGGAAKFAASTAPMALGMGSSGEQAMPPPPQMAPPQMAPPKPRSGPLVSPNQMRRRGGIASLQRPPNGRPRGRIGNSLRGRGIA
jgi:hypothetical protein